MGKKLADEGDEVRIKVIWPDKWCRNHSSTPKGRTSRSRIHVFVMRFYLLRLTPTFSHIDFLGKHPTSQDGHIHGMEYIGFSKFLNKIYIHIYISIY